MIWSTSFGNSGPRPRSNSSKKHQHVATWCSRKPWFNPTGYSSPHIQGYSVSACWGWTGVNSPAESFGLQCHKQTVIEESLKVNFPCYGFLEWGEMIVWKLECLKVWMSENLNVWKFECLKVWMSLSFNAWKFECLKAWKSESLNVSKIEYLKVCMSESLNVWQLECLKACMSESLGVRNLECLKIWMSKNLNVWKLKCLKTWMSKSLNVWKFECH